MVPVTQPLVAPFKWMMNDVGTASVEVTNPTHVAVALRYDAGAGGRLEHARWPQRGRTPGQIGGVGLEDERHEVALVDLRHGAGEHGIGGGVAHGQAPGENED